MKISNEEKEKEKEKSKLLPNLNTRAIYNNILYKYINKNKNTEYWVMRIIYPPELHHITEKMLCTILYIYIYIVLQSL